MEEPGRQYPMGLQRVGHNWVTNTHTGFFFAVQNLLSLIRSHLFIFVFMFITLGSGKEELVIIYAEDCTGYVFL